MSDVVGNYVSSGPSGNMSFNPYNKRPIANNEATIGNNDTKMSNNEAFLAFLQKNDSDEDDDESNNQEEQWIEYRRWKYKWLSVYWESLE